MISNILNYWGLSHSAFLTGAGIAGPEGFATFHSKTGMKQGRHPLVETPCNKDKDTGTTVEPVTLLWHQATAVRSIRNASKALNPLGAPSPASSTPQTGAPGPFPAKQTCNVQIYKCITKGEKKNPEILIAKKLLHWQLVEAFLFPALTPTRTSLPCTSCAGGWL